MGHGPMGIARPHDREGANDGALAPPAQDPAR